ncbi:MAG: Omp28-related outer membrane protein [Flavobacteriales bacterium]|nr:Omp28-related outer membrane protein [Flavobacteriales bacterium]
MRTALLACLLSPALMAQTLVSTEPTNRRGVLEEFTAVNCGVCPQGHAVATSLLAANPGELIVVAVHGGGLATPSGNQPDFRTTAGTSIWSQFGVSSQPTGLMNRTAHNGQLVMSRTQWASALAANLATPAPVNIGAATQFDEDTRLLTVTVEVYNTAAGTGGYDRVHVLLTESNIIGYQQNYQTGAQSAYVHQHVLRTYVSPLWGDELASNEQGALDQRTYTFTVPTGWNINNCHVVAFVGEYQGAIHNAVELGANNFATNTVEQPTSERMLLFPQPTSDVLLVRREANSAPTTFVVRDLAGRTVLELPYSSGDIVSVDVSALSSGTYVLTAPGVAQRFMVAR